MFSKLNVIGQILCLEVKIEEEEWQRWSTSNYLTVWDSTSYFISGDYVTGGGLFLLIKTLLLTNCILFKYHLYTTQQLTVLVCFLLLCVDFALNMNQNKVLHML